MNSLRVLHRYLALFCLLLPVNAEALSGAPVRPVFGIPLYHAHELRADTSERAAMIEALQQALLAQRVAWQQLELRTHGEMPGWQGGQFIEPKMRRSTNIGCPSSGRWIVNIQDSAYPVRNIIRSSRAYRTGDGRTSQRTVCPDWIPKEALAGNTHEARGELATPAELAPFPPALIEALVSFHVRFPEDDVMLRQVIRALTENGDLSRARETAAACDASRIWCGLLHGYVLSLLHRPSDALRAFDRALARLSSSKQCEWNAIPTLNIGSIGAAERWTLCNRFEGTSAASWWLGVPMYSDSVDWRKLEHYVRHVRNAMAGFGVTVPLVASGALQASRWHHRAPRTSAACVAASRLDCDPRARERPARRSH